MRLLSKSSSNVVGRDAAICVDNHPSLVHIESRPCCVIPLLFLSNPTEKRWYNLL